MDKTARTNHPDVLSLFAWTKRRIAIRYRSPPVAGAEEAEHAEADSHQGVTSPLSESGGAPFHPLTLLFGPNAAGKSNFLDALQLLSKLATSRTLKDAFEPPYRGKPLESFTIGEQGLRGLVEKDRLVFSIEADLFLSDAVVEGRQSADTGNAPSERRWPARGSRPYARPDPRAQSSLPRRDRDAAPLGLPAYGRRIPRRPEFQGRTDRQAQTLHRTAGRGKSTCGWRDRRIPTYYDRYLDHTHPLDAALPRRTIRTWWRRVRELESWLFFYFEPRERMRAANPIKEVRHMGLMGEELAAFLNTLKALKPRQFEAVEKALRTVMPNVDGIETDVSDLGEVDSASQGERCRHPRPGAVRGDAPAARATGADGRRRGSFAGGFRRAGERRPPAPHPDDRGFAEDTRSGLGPTQYIVTTHSPILPDLLPDDSLFAVRRIDRRTRIDHSSVWQPLGPMGRRDDIDSGARRRPGKPPRLGAHPDGKETYRKITASKPGKSARLEADPERRLRCVRSRCSAKISPMSR